MIERRLVQSGRFRERRLQRPEKTVVVEIAAWWISCNTNEFRPSVDRYPLAGSHLQGSVNVDVLPLCTTVDCMMDSFG
jgi:hypothetical protein